MSTKSYFSYIEPITSTMHSNIADYYDKRAKEYDHFYAKPEYREDVAAIASELSQIFSSKKVLEIACGTGYWTDAIARVADHVTAIDINDSVLDIAQKKLRNTSNVTFALKDLYEMEPTDKYDALFAGLIWSHIGKEKLFFFLDQIMSLVHPGGTVFFLDQRFVAGKNTPVSKMDGFGNTYQERNLNDGSSYTIMKNFPTEESVRSKLKFCCNQVAFINHEYFWTAKAIRRSSQKDNHT